MTVTTFAYDDGGNRVGQTAGTGEEAVTTTYLIDENNLTGYSQTLEQTDRNSSDEVVKKTTYVVGADVTGQYVTEDSTTTGAIFLKDAHGSTRGLYATTSAGLLDAALVTAGGSTWTKTLTYDAYGNAVGFDPATALTETPRPPAEPPASPRGSRKIKFPISAWGSCVMSWSCSNLCDNMNNYLGIW